MLFTCPPCSTRTRLSKGKVERRTYVSIAGPQAQITLFQEVTDGKAVTSHTSTEVSIAEKSSQAAVYLGIITSKGSGALTDTPDLLVVKEDGEIQCLDGSDLHRKWVSPASALSRDASPVKDAKVDFAHLTNALTASQGILKGRDDIFTLFPQEISETFNPDILIIVTKSMATSTRTLHMLNLPRRLGTHTNHVRQAVESLLTKTLPTPKPGFTEDASFQIQTSTGTIQQLSRDVLTTFDLTTTIPRVISTIAMQGSESFLRLSDTSVMVSTQHSISVYNTKYQSILATIHLDGAPKVTKEKKNVVTATNGVDPHSCKLVSYYPKLSIAVAIANNELLAIQIEGKSRVPGLLIDSLGCAISDQARRGRSHDNPKKLWLTTMESYLQNSTGAVEEFMKHELQQMEIAVAAKDSVRFDNFMAQKLGGNWAESNLSNGVSESRKKKKDNEDVHSKSKLDPSDVDRRWITFALEKIFSWGKVDDNEYRLSISFYPPNVFMWLLETGNMTIANIESALRNQIRLSVVDNLPAGELVNVLVETDPDLDLLLVLISRNYLGAGELLAAIRVLMNSLELFTDDSATKLQFLTNGEDLDDTNEDIEARIKELAAEAEADLALAEYQLGTGSGVRGEALSLALLKLYTCPTDTVIFALQTTFTNQEIVSLIYLLRFELARGAWTSKYLDLNHTDSTDDEREIADNSIILISSLLNDCIDSIGAGGWISGDARLVNGDPFEAEELIASLKLEVSAALEGIEEATYLKGLISEMIRYGDALHDGLEKRNATHNPILLPSADEDVSILPLGLKADQKISLLRVGAGGEVHKRSARDIGRLKSHKVEKYSVERIVI